MSEIPQYFVEVTFTDADEVVWDHLTRSLGLVECYTQPQAIAVAQFFADHPLVELATVLIETESEAPRPIWSSDVKTRQKYQHAERQRQEAIDILGEDSQGFQEWLVRDGEGDEY